MITFSVRFATVALPLALALTALPASAQTAGGFAPRAPQGGQLIGQQWMTTASGCSYSRTQAPGQRPVWMLIQNPHHIGQRNASSRCPSMIQG